MRIQRLQKRLEKSEDKLSIFANKKILNRYSLNAEELLNIIETYLTDEQKAKLFEFEHFRKLFPYRIKAIIELIKDDKLKLKLLEDDDLLLDMDEFNIVDIIKSLTDYGKMQILQNKNFIEKHTIYEYHIIGIIKSLRDESKISLLSNKNFVKKELKLDEFDISNIIESIENEDEKLKFMEEYGFQSYETVEILLTLSDKYKETVLTENKYKLRKNDMIEVLISMDIKTIINCLNEHKQFFIENNISPYFIMEKIDSKKQLEFISKLQELELSTRRKETNICKTKTRNKRKNWNRRLSKRM